MKREEKSEGVFCLFVCLYSFIVKFQVPSPKSPSPKYTFILHPSIHLPKFMFHVLFIISPPPPTFPPRPDGDNLVLFWGSKFSTRYYTPVFCFIGCILFFLMSWGESINQLDLDLDLGSGQG